MKNSTIIRIALAVVIILGIVRWINHADATETSAQSIRSVEASVVLPINPFKGSDGFTGYYKDPAADTKDIDTFLDQAEAAGYTPYATFGAVKVEGDKKTIIRRHTMGDQVIYEYEDVSHLDPAQAYIWATKGRPAPSY